MNYILSQIKAFAALCIVVVFVYSSCQRKQSPAPQPVPVDSLTNTIVPESNSLVLKNKVYFTQPGKYGKFKTSFTSVNQFITKDLKDTITLYVSLQNSNPASGSYKIGTHQYGTDFLDIYPGIGKVELACKINGKLYESSIDCDSLVKVNNQGDSIEVSFTNVPLHAYTWFIPLISAKLKIATKEVKPIYDGSATFSGGVADTVLYSNKDGIHSFWYRNTSYIQFNQGTLNLYFFDFPKESKVYKVSHRYPVNDDEVTLNCGYYGPSPFFTTGQLFLTKNNDGSFSFSFKDIESPGTQNLFGDGVITSFMP